MTAGLLIAACLTVLLGAAHSYLGEKYILIRLFRRENLPRLLGGVEFTKQTLRFAWHLTTVAWIGLAAIMVAASAPTASSAVILQIVSVTSATSGVVALVGSRGRHLSWIVFFLVAFLSWPGWP